jgi:Domain of unknown function (DUF1707)
VQVDRIRASDAEREQTVTLLRAAVAEGRLSLEELDERTATAYAAATRGELEQLVDDLPRELPAPAVARSRKRRPRVPGRISFSARWRAPAGREPAVADFLELVAPPLNSFGYQLVDRAPERLVFERGGRPAWTIVVAVVFFPLGLIALAYKGSERIAVDFVERGDETSVIAQGVAPLRVRRAFSELEN